MSVLLTMPSRIVLLLALPSPLAAALSCAELHEPYGHVESEDGNYESNNAYCWLIRPTGRARVHISFRHFQTEPDFDRVYVFDGADVHAPLLSPQSGFSGSTIPAPMTSTQGSVLVMFASDFMVAMKGFTFAWTSDGGQDYPASSPLCAEGCDKLTSLQNHVCDLACFNAQVLT